MRAGSRIVLAAAVAGALGATVVATPATAGILCKRKSGVVVVREELCKRREQPVDVDRIVERSTPVGQLATQVAALATQVPGLQQQVAALASQVEALAATSFLVAGDPGTVAGWATVDAGGTLVEGFSHAGGAVGATRSTVGTYTVSFGFQIRPDQPIVAVARETSGREICRVVQGGASKSAVDVLCAEAAEGSPALDVAFTVLVLN
jgi:hypothetical protein